MNNISDFIGTFRNGFQRSSRFVCQILVTPTLVANIIADSTRGNNTLFGIIDRALNVENAVISVPQVVKWLAQGYLVESARMPDRGFAQLPLSMYGITEHFPYHTEYAEFDCSFLLPLATNIKNDNAVPRFFSYWQNQIQRASKGPDSGFDFAFPNDYYATILLTLLDSQNNGTITYKFTNAYPKTVDSSPVAWGDNDKFLSLPVSFTYSYWTIQPEVESLALSFVDQLFS